MDVEPWEAGSLVLLCPVLGAPSSARASNHTAAASATKSLQTLRLRRSLAQTEEASPQHERPVPSAPARKGMPSHKLRLEIDPQFFELLDPSELSAAWHDAYAHAEHAGLPRATCNPFHGSPAADSGGGGEGGGAAAEPGATTSYVPAGTAGVRLRPLPTARRSNFTPDLFVTYQESMPRAPVVRCVPAETARTLQREAQTAQLVAAGFVHPPSSPLARPASKPWWQHEDLHGRPGDRVVVRSAGVATSGPCSGRGNRERPRATPPNST